VTERKPRSGRGRWSHGAGVRPSRLVARKDRSQFRLQRMGRRDRPVTQLPSVGSRILIIGGLAVVVFAVLLFRLWFLQILTGQQYVAAANENRLRTVKLEARRGLIVDRNGKVLVTNRPSLEVGIRPMDVPADKLGGVILELAGVLDAKDLPASRVLARALRSMDVSMGRLGKLATEISRGSGESVQQVLRAAMESVYVDPELREDAAGELAAATGLTQAQCEALVKHAVSKRTGYAYDLAVIRSGVSKKKVIELRERAPSLPGVEVRKGFTRGYPQGTLAAHLLGSVGEVTGDQLKEARWSKRAAGDLVGQGGVEYTYDDWLRGLDGQGKVEVDSLGRPKRTVSGGSLPRTGDDLVLSIDSKIQKAAERALLLGIEQAHKDQFWHANGGAAVVMDAQTGEIVAMASYPTFEPNVWQNGLSKEEYKQYSTAAANRPFFDRAIQGGYPTGSTFKVVDAIAALEAGIISPYTSFNCEGDFTSKGLTWKCWISPDGHGTLDLTGAITQSCDVYFYNLGAIFFSRPGTELADWAGRLGMGKRTGVDLPGENPGLVPTPDWRRQHFKDSPDPTDVIWKPGNSINLAIGQGDLSATPLQVAVTYAAVANGGYVVTPHIGLEVRDASGQTVQELRAPARRRVGASLGSIQVVQRALRYAASSPVGTSTPVFGGYPVAVAGKTGTAEVFGQDDYAWYASYAPYQVAKGEKQYVVVAMIEQGGHGGSTAAPAVRAIYDALFDVKSSGAVTTGPSD
jgi:penicillin-binding protein 2